jgi:uncharacterized protein (DUF305 family)
MQGMIMHHVQAVEMTALIASHTENQELRSLGARISSSQADEINFMKRWLSARGEAKSMASMPGASHGMPGMSMSQDSSGHPAALMPGMLTPEQMQELGKAKGAEFDHLFLTDDSAPSRALTMVKDLFDTAGAGGMPKFSPSRPMRTIAAGGDQDYAKYVNKNPRGEAMNRVPALRFVR